MAAIVVFNLKRLELKGEVRWIMEVEGVEIVL